MTTAVGSTTDTSTNSILQNYLTQQANTIAAANAASASGTSSTSTATANGVNTLEGVTGNFQTFLKILTTQLQNQDPTSATDPNQFTQELVEFSGVEQQLNTNSDLQTLINLQKNSTGLTATLNYIGKYVEVPSATQLPLQNSQAELAYTLPSTASSVSINVLDSTGKTVATLTGSTAAGLDRVAWDGKDSSGTQLADGTYTYQLNATATDGTAMTVSDVRAVGLVTAVQSNTDGTTSLEFTSGMTTSSTTVDAVYDTSSPPVATLGDPSSSSTTSTTSSS